jgi:hypothetical protein
MIAESYLILSVYLNDSTVILTGTISMWGNQVKLAYGYIFLEFCVDITLNFILRRHTCYTA